jgi:hypothetical protein
MAREIRAFQIFYDAQTRAMVDPQFEALDNSKNERPDWYEYWPIRNYLLSNRLEESAYYGFLSPQFFGKTHLSGAQVRDFIGRADGADVIAFSPFPCQAACFLNVFEQGECFVPGLLKSAAPFFARMDAGADLDALVTDSRNTVFCNYFVATASFWTRWRQIFEELFAQAEAADASLHSLLNDPLQYQTYHKSTLAHSKIFIMERAVSFILATSGAFTVKMFPPFEMPLIGQFRAVPMSDLVTLDALKIAYAETRDAGFLKAYRELQTRTLAAVFA